MGGNPWSGGTNTGKILDLSTTTTFKQSDGTTFIINCTADAEFNSTGSFSDCFSITIYNVGTHIITLDSTYDIEPGQRAVFAYDGVDFIGGV